MFCVGWGVNGRQASSSAMHLEEKQAEESLAKLPKLRNPHTTRTRRTCSEPHALTLV